jgi:hypothetical protein
MMLYTIIKKDQDFEKAIQIFEQINADDIAKLNEYQRGLLKEAEEEI